jgi:hypothetical protein
MLDVKVPDTFRTIEERIQRLEAIAYLEQPPHEWITPDKVSAVRNRLNCSMSSAITHLVSNFGDEKL